MQSYFMSKFFDHHLEQCKFTNTYIVMLHRYTGTVQQVQKFLILSFFLFFQKNVVIQVIYTYTDFIFNVFFIERYDGIRILGSMDYLFLALNASYVT